MKRFVLFFMILSAAVFAGFAQTASDLFAETETVPITFAGTDTEAQEEGLPEELLDALKKPWKTGDTISLLTADFSTEKKNAILDDYSKTHGKAIGLNWLGFGIGSFTQGDALGGALGVTFDVLGYGSMIAAGGFFIIDLFVAVFSLGTAEEEVSKIAGIGAGFLIGGVVLWLGNRIMGTIRPLTFEKKYNGSLKTALGLDDVIEDLSFVPIVDPVESRFGLLTHVSF